MKRRPPLRYSRADALAELRNAQRQRESLWQYRCGLWIFLAFFAVGVLTWIVLAFALQMPGAQMDLRTPAPPIGATTTPPAATTTGPTTVSPTTTTGPPSTTTTQPATTSPPPPPVIITCPPDTVGILGKPDSPAELGNAVASGGCTPPVVTHSDVVTGTVTRRAVPPSPRAPASMTEVVRDEQQQRGASYTGTRWNDAATPTMSTEQQQQQRDPPSKWREVNPRRNAHVLPPPPPPQQQVQEQRLVSFSRRQQTQQRRRRQLYPRSPSFSAANVQTVNAVSVSNTGVLPPDPVAAAGDTEVVFAVNGDLGTRVTVYDKSLSNTLGSFALASLGTGVCGAPSNDGDPQVMYDQDARRWILLEFVTANNTICLFRSNTANPLGSWMEFQFPFGGDFPDYPKLGLWNRVYALTINIPPTLSVPNPQTLCVLDRLAILQGNATVDMFCAAPFLGPLGGFGFQAWTPVDSEGGPLAPAATEGSGTPGVGAVFVRHNDDELHDPAGASPAVDFLEVEHWTNIDFTAGTYVNVRYRVQIADFDSSAGSCPFSDECIPAPVPAQDLDPLREVVMHRAVFRYLPDCDDQQSLVVAFVSHANGVDNARVRWAELRYKKPSPSQEPRFVLHQEGAINPTPEDHRWMPTPAMDGNGTIVIGYAISSPVRWPSMAVVSRLGSDPLGFMRDEQIAVAGPAGAIPSGRWGDYFSMSTDPAPGQESRNFYFAGQTTSATFPWDGVLLKFRVLGDVIERTFLAQDSCGQSATCVQMVQLE